MRFHRDFSHISFGLRSECARPSLYCVLGTEDFHGLTFARRFDVGFAWFNTGRSTLRRSPSAPSA